MKRPRRQDFKIMRNQCGFTLVEILIFLALVGYGLVGSMSLIDYLGTNQNTHRFLVSTDNLVDEIRRELGNEASCTFTLEGFELDPAVTLPVPAIKNELDALEYNPGDTYMDGGVRLQAVRAVNYQDLTAPNGRLILELEFLSPNKVAGFQTSLRTIQINTVKTGTTLSSCSSSSKTGEDPWQQTTVPGGVFYQTNVGIGTNSPTALLDVKGGYIHAELDCRKVLGPSTNRESLARCDADEYVVSGGGHCLRPDLNPTTGGLLVESYPLADLSGWQADCLIADQGIIQGITGNIHIDLESLGEAYAICCKK